MKTNTFFSYILQIQSLPSPLENFQKIESFIKKIPLKHPTPLISLPETCLFRGNEEKKVISSEKKREEFHIFFSKLAKKNNFFLLAPFLEKIPNSKKFYNTSYLFNPSGEEISTYKKIHLFDAIIQGKEEGSATKIIESNYIQAGTKAMIAEINDWKVGLAICYDLRFPEFFRNLRSQGAEIFLIPSNFTLTTGRMHWEVLLRARAIENQCYVIAPNQCGKNLETHQTSYGNSLVIDPWGKIIVRGTEKNEEILFCSFNKKVLQDFRNQMPVWEHRRLSL